MIPFDVGLVPVVKLTEPAKSLEVEVIDIVGEVPAPVPAAIVG
jgi:hypothetical protein